MQIWCGLDNRASNGLEQWAQSTLNSVYSSNRRRSIRVSIPCPVRDIILLSLVWQVNIRDMTEIVVAADEEQLLSRISNLVARAADDAISRDDRIFRFGISGDDSARKISFNSFLSFPLSLFSIVHFMFCNFYTFSICTLYTYTCTRQR